MKKWEWLKERWLIACIPLVCLLWLGVQGRSASLSHLVPLEEGGLDQEALTFHESEESEAEFIYVDLKGAVQSPGVYLLAPGSRLFDLLEEAGGLLPEAAEEALNLAQRLEDQMVLYVWTQEEYQDQVQAEGFDHLHGLESQAASEGLVNINQATSEELQSLPGIGPKKAAAIIDYRESVGSFQVIEDLMEVSGIGSKTFEQLEALIVVR